MASFLFGTIILAIIVWVAVSHLRAIWYIQTNGGGNLNDAWWKFLTFRKPKEGQGA